MSHSFKARWLLMIALLLLAANAAGNTIFGELEGLPPGEQYRQLSLITLIADGADPALLNFISPTGFGTGQKVESQLRPDDYKTPLIRIVDQETMLDGAAFLLRFAQESRDDIRSSLVEINTGNPILISLVDMNAITEDAIVIRNAIADAIGFSSKGKDPALSSHLESYRTRTIHIRNVLEYEQFDEDLARLTEEAIVSVGGKLDAYQRMFDEEVDSKEFDRQFDAADYIYNRTEKFDIKAGKLTEEIMKNVILSQSQPIK